MFEGRDQTAGGETQQPRPPRPPRPPHLPPLPPCSGFFQEGAERLSRFHSLTWDVKWKIKRGARSSGGSSSGGGGSIYLNQRRRICICRTTAAYICRHLSENIPIHCIVDLFYWRRLRWLISPTHLQLT